MPHRQAARPCTPAARRPPRRLASARGGAGLPRPFSEPPAAGVDKDVAVLGGGAADARAGPDRQGARLFSPCAASLLPTKPRVASPRRPSSSPPTPPSWTCCSRCSAEAASALRAWTAASRWRSASGRSTRFVRRVGRRCVLLSLERGGRLEPSLTPRGDSSAGATHVAQVRRRA